MVWLIHTKLYALKRLMQCSQCWICKSGYCYWYSVVNVIKGKQRNRETRKEIDCQFFTRFKTKKIFQWNWVFPIKYETRALPGGMIEKEIINLLYSWHLYWHTIKQVWRMSLQFLLQYVYFLKCCYVYIKLSCPKQKWSWVIWALEKTDSTW